MNRFVAWGFIAMRACSVSILGAALLFPLGCEPALDEGEEADVAASETRILLSPEEARQFEVDNGGVFDERIIGGELVLFGDSDVEPVIEPDVEPAWCSGLYLTNVVKAAGTYYFLDRRLSYSQGTGPMVLSLEVSKQISSEFTADVSVSSSAVSAGVGYTIGASFGISSSASINVPSGSSQRLEAYTAYEKKTFDIWDDDCGDPMDTYKGKGKAYKPVGVYFKTVTF